MKRKLLFITLCTILVSCSTGQGVGEDSLKRELYSMRRAIADHGNDMAFLGDKRVGQSGYFYIISKQGIVVFHPNPIVIGRSFREFDFTARIIEKEEGVLHYGREGMMYRVYFVPLDSGEILCLSIPENEIKS